MAPIRENLLEGFLSDRDQETFVYSDEENRLGWEDDLDEDDAFSVHTIGKGVDYTPKQRHVIAHTAATNVVAVMDLPFKCNVAFTPQDNFYDGKTIHVATAVLDDEDLNFGEQLDVIKGLAVHEAAHADSTEWEQFKYFSNKNSTEPIKKALFNIVEDERIERIVGDKTPGYSRFLSKTKDYMFDKKYLDKVPDESKMTDADKIIDEILKFVRYPKYLDEDKLEDYEDELFSAKSILTSFKGGYPLTQTDCEKSVDELYEVVKKYCEKKEEEKSSEEGKSSGEGKSKTPKMSPSMEAALSSVTHGADSFEGIRKDDLSEFVKEKGDEAREIEESMEFDAESKCTFEHAPPTGGFQYETFRKKVSAASSTISKMLRWESKNRVDNLTRLKSGGLDTNFLVEARQRVDNIYFRKRKVKSQKISVVLLLDESGSMRGERIKSAIEASVLFIEALKKVPHVDLYIYGHTADMPHVFKGREYDEYAAFSDGVKTNIIIYKEPGFDNSTSITTASGKSQNRDGVAILETAKRVRKYTNDKILYLVISDGSPSASGYSGYAHTKECVNKVERMGMHVVQVAIADGVNSDRMFKNYVTFKNVSSLSRDMGRLMKTLVTKLSSTVVD